MSNGSPSLKDFDVISDRIRAHRQAEKNPIVFVEGPSDKNLIRRVTQKSWDVFIAGTRDQVAVEVAASREVGVARVAGIIDRDFDNYADSIRDSDLPIFTFREADLEAFLVAGPWFDFLVEEFGSYDKLRNNGGSMKLREIAIDHAKVMGVLRWANCFYGWGVNFDELNFSKKINKKTLALNVESLFASMRAKIELSDGRQALDLIKDSWEEYRESSLFRGRDALDVVRVSLYYKFATRKIDDVESIASALRLSVSSELLKAEPFSLIGNFFDHD